MSRTKADHPSRAGGFSASARAATVSRVVGVAAAAAFNIGTARLLGAEDFGLLALGLSVASILSSMLSFQIGAQSSRSFGHATSPSYRHAVYIGGLGTVVMLAFVPLARAWGPDGTSVLLLLIPLIASEPFLQLAVGRHYALGEALRAAVVQAVPPVIRTTVVLLVLVARAPSAVAAAVAIGASSMIFILASPFYVPGDDPASEQSFSVTLRAGLLLGVLAANWIVVQRTDTLIIELFEPRSAVGAYTAVQRLYDVPLTLYSATMTAFIAPAAVASVGRIRLLISTAQSVVVGLLPFLVFLSVWGGPTAKLLFGPGFVVPWPVFAMLSLAITVHIVFGYASAVLVAKGSEGYVAAVAGTAGVLNIGLSFGLGAQFGVSGVAAATLAALAFMNGLCWRRYEQQSDTDTSTAQGEKVARVVVGSLIVVGLLRFTMPATSATTAVAAASAGLLSVLTWVRTRVDLRSSGVSISRADVSTNEAGRPFLFVSHGHRWGGGAEFVFQEMLEAIRDVDPSLPLVAVYPKTGPMSRRARRLDVRAIVAPQPRWADFGHKSLPVRVVTWLRLAAAFGFALLVLGTTRPRAVVTNTMTIPSFAAAARLLGIPHFWMVQEFGDLDHDLQFLLGYERTVRLMSQWSERIICCSHAVQSRLTEMVPGMCSRVVYYSVDIERVEPRPRRESAPLRAVLVGRICPEKGQDLAVRSLAAARREGVDVELLLVGPGQREEVGRVRDLAEDLLVGPHVEIRPETSEVEAVLRRSDVALMCSRNEAFGRVTVEAMKAGLPVCGTAIGGTAEIIRHGRNGFLVAPEDHERLGQCLVAFATDEELRLEMAWEAFDSSRYFNRERFGIELLESLDVRRETA